MEENVGTIVIATKVDKKGFEKGVKELEDKEVVIKYTSDRADVADERWHQFKAGTEKEYNKWVEEQNANVGKQVNIQKELTSELQNQALAEQKIKDIQSQPAQEPIEYEFIPGYTAQIEQLTKKLNDLKATYNMLANEPGFKEDSQDAMELEAEIEKVNQQLNNMIEKQKKLDRGGFKGLATQLKGMEKGFTSMVKKAGRLALALIGIRTIINLITRSFNTLSQYNEELGTKMEQMRLVLAVALEPIINWIVNLLQVVLTLINQIYSALAGINLFGRASELWSKKMAKNMASGAGSAKEMRKQLAGFDEMNVLGDNVASSGGGGGGSGMDDWMLEEKQPVWMDWIKKNGPLIAGILAGIATALGLIKLGINGIKALGIGTIVAGIVMLVLDLMKYIKDPSWENFANIIRDIGIILIGIGIAIGGTVGIVVAVIGAIAILVAEIIKNWDKVKAFIQGISDWLHGKAQSLTKESKGFAGGIFEILAKALEDLIFVCENVVTSIKTLFDGVIEFFKHAFKGEWDEAWQEIVKAFTKVWNDGVVKLFEKTWERLKENLNIVKGMIKSHLDNVYNWIYEKIFNILVQFENLKQNIINKINATVDGIKNRFNQLLGFFVNFGITIGNTVSGAIKGAVNGALSWIENKVNTFIRMINNVVSIINKIPGVSISRISTISLPRLATGGIINQPGRGVPIGGAIAGESGREGILPLTDRQAMAELGKEIGKWININATIPVSIGNRQVARIIEEINKDREFAMNS